MMGVYTEVNVVDVVLFTRSRANDVVTFTLEIPKTIKKIMEQHFQYVAQKFMNDKNLDSFAAHSAKKFTQKNVHKNVAKVCLSIYFLR